MHPIAVLIETGDTAVMDLVDELCKPLPIKKTASSLTMALNPSTLSWFTRAEPRFRIVIVFYSRAKSLHQCFYINMVWLLPTEAPSVDFCVSSLNMTRKQLPIEQW